MNKTLEDLRKEIDILDEELVNILAKRFDVIREIGKVKKENNIPPLDEIRWQQVVETITEKAAKNNLSENLIKEIYEKIHNAALREEEK